MTKTEEEKIQQNFLNYFLIKNYNLLMSNLQEKPSASKEENILHFKNEI
jgi:hypothetical protein